MLKAFLRAIFGCPHPGYSWPLSRVNGKRVPAYVVCNTCGMEFSFNEENFTVGPPLDKKQKPKVRQDLASAVHP